MKKGFISNYLVFIILIGISATILSSAFLFRMYENIKSKSENKIIASELLNKIENKCKKVLTNESFIEKQLSTHKDIIKVIGECEEYKININKLSYKKCIDNKCVEGVLYVAKKF